MKRSVGLWSASVVATAVLVSAQSALGELIGASEFLISVTPGAWFPDVAYDSVDGKYLVVWPDYGNSPVRIAGRFVTNGGAVSGAPFFISDANGGLFPAIAYNAVNNEFLVTWDDQRPGFAIWGQRIRASDGVLLGPNFQIGQTGGIRSAVGWNAGSNVYLVTWWGGGEISGRRIGGTGTPLGSQFNISNDPYFDGYPAVASDNGSQFLVSWDFSSADNIGYIYAQRVDAATGNNTGAVIPVSLSGDRSCIAYDPANSRWLVQFNQGNPGQSYDQFGQLVNTAGSLVGGPIAIANTAGFEGDTQFGGDVDFAPLGRFFSSFGTDTGMGGRELLASNSQLLTPQTVVLGTGAYTSVNNAADTALNRFLTVWDGTANAQSTAHHVWGRLYEPTDLVAPAPVTNLTAVPGSALVRLSWTNPSTSDFTGTMIRSKIGSAPTSAFDGQLVTNSANTPGSNDAFIHQGLTGGATYFYAAFAHDAHPNYAASVTASATPGALGDFDVDGDVDQIDFAFLQRCFSGSATAYVPSCIDADFDTDGDVDGSDLGSFLNCMNGPDHAPSC